jgi:hypothetical protein
MKAPNYDVTIPIGVYMTPGDLAKARRATRLLTGLEHSDSTDHDAIVEAALDSRDPADHDREVCLARADDLDALRFALEDVASALDRAASVLRGEDDL